MATVLIAIGIIVALWEVFEIIADVITSTRKARAERLARRSRMRQKEAVAADFWRTKRDIDVEAFRASRTMDDLMRQRRESRYRQ